jgi:hypothetical protein
MYKIISVVIVLILLSIIFSCKSNDSVTQSEKTSLDINLRMEVHVVDSLYGLYSRPHTKTYLINYLDGEGGERLEVDESDTTTCKNGWAVKEIVYKINSSQTIILGATTIYPPDLNYNYVTITYKELESLKDEDNSVRMIKTFSIFE